MTALNFSTVPNWTFSEQEEKASQKLLSLREEAASQLPADYKSSIVKHYVDRILTLFEEIRKTKMYGALKTLPKGVVHHVHFDCCEDEDFYAQHIINDPIIYLSANLDSFNLGTKEQAETSGWVTMQVARSKFSSESEFIQHVSNLTMLNKHEIEENFSSPQAACWDKFEKKITNFFPILGAVHLFKKYTIHVLKKFIKNGYTRIEFRSFLSCLTEYNENGETVKVYDEKKFMDVFDEAFEIVKGEYPQLSAGFIFFGLKMLSPEDNIKLLSNALEKKWPKTVGIDFVQQEDPFGSQVPYDHVANTVLAKFPDQDIKKVYHVGETKDHLNRNIEVAINAGTVRIGHGINILQHPDLIDIVREKKICFEKSPVSNLLLSYVRDPRVATAQLLLGLGVPVTINPDDPGKFGLEDTTMDYFVTFISSNWDLRHLKLVAIYSINHAVCSEELKKEILEEFEKRWNAWVSDFSEN